MKKAGLHISAEATAVQGPRGLSIKEFKFKETLSNGDNVYQVILENNTVIGELTAKKGDKGLKGDTGDNGNGIIDIKAVEKVDKTNNWEISYTNGKKDYISVQDGDSAFEVAVDNGFTWEWTGEGEEPLDYGVKKWLESLIGKGLEFEWKGTQLGVRVEGETQYQYVDLKGEKGKNLEFNWNGTQLGVRQEGQNDYQYQNLQGPKGNDGKNGTNGANGKNLEFTWRGTELGVRVQGDTEYQYVNLKGDQGDEGSFNTSGTYNDMTVGYAKLLTDRGTITAEVTPNGISGGNGLSMQRAYNNGYPTAYGNVINLKGSGQGQIFIGWSGTTGAKEDAYIRSMRDQGNTWSEWAKIYTDKNLSVYTKSEIDTKFKNYPVPVGGILLMYNTSNPAELYSGTTWELLATDKYLKTTTGTPLSVGGSNSFAIQKANLPAIKVQLDNFSLTRGTMNITGEFYTMYENDTRIENYSTGAFKSSASTKLRTEPSEAPGPNCILNNFDASRSWTGNTGTASPYTQNLGNGTAITVNPTYITIRAWKRLS